MTETQRFAERDVVARQYGYSDGDVLAVDLGSGTDGAVDVVDGTLMVVVEGDQFELELPEAAGGKATINNGVVTVEMHDSAADGADRAGTEPTGGDGEDDHGAGEDTSEEDTNR